MPRGLLGGVEIERIIVFDLSFALIQVIAPDDPTSTFVYEPSASSSPGLLGQILNGDQYFNFDGLSDIYI